MSEEMKPMSKEDLMKACKNRFKAAEIPDFGVLNLRILSAAEMIQYTAESAKLDDKDAPCHLAVTLVCDERGEPMFDSIQEAMILGHDVLNNVAKQGKIVNGLSGEVVEQTAKN